MSTRERIQNDIEHNRLLLQEVISDISGIQEELKQEDLSEEKKKELEEKLKSLEDEQQDLSSDIAMLKELLDKFPYEEPDLGEECYDGFDEVFTGGDY